MSLSVVKSQGKTTTFYIAVFTEGPPFLPESFDRILLDAPCSGMGQRPTMSYSSTLKELMSYQPLQRKLFTVVRINHWVAKLNWTSIVLQCKIFFPPPPQWCLIFPIFSVVRCWDVIVQSQKFQSSFYSRQMECQSSMKKSMKLFAIPSLYVPLSEYKFHVHSLPFSRSTFFHS